MLLNKEDKLLVKMALWRTIASGRGKCAQCECKIPIGDYQLKATSSSWCSKRYCKQCVKQMNVLLQMEK